MATPRRPRQRFATALLALLVVLGALAAGLVIAARIRTGEWHAPTGDDLVWIRRSLRGGGAPAPPRVIYLHRGGIELRGGTDAAADDRSSVVGERDSDVAKVPKFSGSDRTWRKIVSCVQDLFAPFDVAVVDRRPARPGYILVAVGGRSDLLPGGHSHGHESVGGLAPFDGAVIPDAVVFAFSATLENRVRPICETIGMEVAHAYGLDHGYECRDVMTYLPGCKRRFLDKDVPCGEARPRPCHGGGATQNSYRHLLRVLGPHAGARAPGSGP
jgi:hypothetical protein